MMRYIQNLCHCIACPETSSGTEDGDLRKHHQQRLISDIIVDSQAWEEKWSLSRKKALGSFSYSEVHLTLQKITFPYKIGEGEKEILHCFFKKWEKFITHLSSSKTVIPAGIIQFCPLGYVISHQGSTTYIPRIQSNHLLLNGKNNSAPLPICQWYKERFPLSSLVCCLWICVWYVSEYPPRLHIYTCVYIWLCHIYIYIWEFKNRKKRLLCPFFFWI